MLLEFEIEIFLVVLTKTFIKSSLIFMYWELRLSKLEIKPVGLNRTGLDRTSKFTN